MAEIPTETPPLAGRGFSGDPNKRNTRNSENGVLFSAGGHPRIHLIEPAPAPLRNRNHGAIEPPWQAVKEWIPDDEPELDWFNRPRNPSNPDPDGLDQSPEWQAPEIKLDDERILVLDDT